MQLRQEGQRKNRGRRSFFGSPCETGSFLRGSSFRRFRLLRFFLLFLQLFLQDRAVLFDESR